MRTIERLLGMLVGALLVACLLAPAFGGRSQDGPLDADVVSSDDLVPVVEGWRGSRRAARERILGGG